MLGKIKPDLQQNTEKYPPKSGILKTKFTLYTNHKLPVLPKIKHIRCMNFEQK